LLRIFTTPMLEYLILSLQSSMLVFCFHLLSLVI
jgi:hypothetical protein